MEHQIVINLSEDGQITMTTNPPMPMPMYLQVVMSTIEATAQATINGAPEEHRTQVRDDLYGLLNFAASAVLDRIDPEYVRNPGLTAEAILKAENEIIEEQYAAIPRAERRRRERVQTKARPAPIVQFPHSLPTAPSTPGPFDAQVAAPTDDPQE